MTDWLAQHVMACRNAGGMIAKAGGITCHASIVARELNIPTLISFPIEMIEEGRKASLDATGQKVEIK